MNFTVLAEFWTKKRLTSEFLRQLTSGIVELTFFFAKSINPKITMLSATQAHIFEDQR